MRLISSALTDVGLHRDKNDDSFLDELGLYAVADGMGGHAGGEVASRMAVDTLRQGRTWAMIFAPDDPAGLKKIFARAHEAIMRESRRVVGLWGMGTTMTALRVDGEGRAHVGHAGDTACVLVRNGRPTALTRPHTVAGMRPRGAEEVDSRLAHVLLNCLGGGPDMSPTTETCEIQLLPNDIVVLASDGLTDYASAERIAEIVEHSRDDAWREPGETTAQVAARNLVQHALGSGGHDNVTVVVVEVCR